MNRHSSSRLTRRRLLLAGAAALTGRATAKDNDPPHVRVLFLGSSHMAANGLPALVGEMLLSTGMFAPHIASYLMDNYRLEQHAADENAMKLIKQGADDGKPWDVVVAQELSLASALAGVDKAAQQAMSDGLSKLAALAREANSKMLVVVLEACTFHPSLWEKQSKEALITGANAVVAQARIRHANAKAAQAAREKSPGADILVSPAGDFWQLMLSAYPAMPLYAKDGAHPDMLGSMLSALVIVGTIGGRGAIQRTSWTGECPFSQVEQAKKVLLEHPEVFMAAGK